MPQQQNNALEADVIIPTDFAGLLDKIFGTIDNPHTPQETKDAISGLSVSELIAARAYIGQREAQFKEINSRIDAVINSKDVSEFPQENSLFAVSDSTSQETIGCVRVETKKDMIRSTKDKRVAEKVKDEIARLGLQSQYTKMSVELKNDVLFADKTKGILPASLDNMLSEQEKNKRVTSFVPLNKEEK